MKVGITGHQDLSKYNLRWIAKTIEFFLVSNNIKKGFSSLAIGSDQLFVKLLLKLNIDYDVIIPSVNYESTFKNPADLIEYKRLLKAASSAQTLDFFEPNEQAFFDAGKKVVEVSDYLIAVWNGEKAKGLGGTADIIKYAAEISKRVLHINPVNQTQTILNRQK